MSDGTAFSSSNPEVIDVWDEHKVEAERVHELRTAFMDTHGRQLTMRRLWGSGSEILGFAVEKPYDDKLLRVERGSLVPRLSTKAGKALEAELRTLRLDNVNLPGMPTSIFHVLRLLAPALNELDGVLWAYWPGDIDLTVPGVPRKGDQVDKGLWEKQPLSAYYSAKEAHAAEVASRG